MVHHFTIKCVVYGAIAAALARVPARVNAVAGLGYVFTNKAPKARLLRPLVRGLMRLVLNNRHARLILQNRDDLAVFQRARLIHPDRVRLIQGSGVDTERFQPVNRLAASGEATKVRLASRLLWNKGIGEYVEAARQLRGEGLNVRFLLAGAPALPSAGTRPADGPGLAAPGLDRVRRTYRDRKDPGGLSGVTARTEYR